MNIGGNALPHDPFARQTATHAHNRIAELTKTVARLEKALARRRMPQDCYFCGDPVKKGSRYCHAHSWAEGGG